MDALLRKSTHRELFFYGRSLELKKRNPEDPTTNVYVKLFEGEGITWIEMSPCYYPVKAGFAGTTEDTYLRVYDKVVQILQASDPVDLEAPYVKNLGLKSTDRVSTWPGRPDVQTNLARATWDKDDWVEFSSIDGCTYFHTTRSGSRFIQRVDSDNGTRCIGKVEKVSIPVEIYRKGEKTLAFNLQYELMETRTVRSYRRMGQFLEPNLGNVNLEFLRFCISSPLMLPSPAA